MALYFSLSISLSLLQESHSNCFRSFNGFIWLNFPIVASWISLASRKILFYPKLLVVASSIKAYLQTYLSYEAIVAAATGTNSLGAAASKDKGNKTRGRRSPELLAWNNTQILAPYTKPPVQGGSTFKSALYLSPSRALSQTISPISPISPILLFISPLQTRKFTAFYVGANRSLRIT